MITECPECHAPAIRFKKRADIGNLVCNDCGSVISPIIDEGQEWRDFRDSNDGQQRHRAGRKIDGLSAQSYLTSKGTSSSAASIANAKERINHLAVKCDISNDLAQQAVLMFHEYKRKKEIQLKSRNMDIMAAAAILLSLKWELDKASAHAAESAAGGAGSAGPSKVPFKHSRRQVLPQYESLRCKLERLVEGLGRASSKNAPLDNQLKDMKLIVNIHTLSSVSAYIPELVTMCSLPRTAAKLIRECRDLLLPVEEEKVPNVLNVPTYTLIVANIVLGTVRTHLPSSAADENRRILPLEIMCGKIGVSCDMVSAETTAILKLHVKKLKDFLDGLERRLKIDPNFIFE